MLNNKRVFITGISGFVGSHLAKYLLDHGNEVHGLIRRRADGSKPKNLIKLRIYEQLHLIEGDISSISSLGAALEIAKPDIIFHLAAQSFIPASFLNPLETLLFNSLGTANLLESVRIKDIDSIIVFAGSSEEYGLVFASEKQYKRALKKMGTIFPPAQTIPELPISEANCLRPMSPYAISKVQGDYLMRGYHNFYGLKTVVSRGFNAEGPGRGSVFVTSMITNQVMRLKLGETDKIVIGNVNAFRDWSHIADIVEGYRLIAENGQPGEVYNQGSGRTNSILSYILLSLERAGWRVEKIETMNEANRKTVADPVQMKNDEIFGLQFEKTRVDQLLLRDELDFALEDKGIWVYTDKGKIPIEFDSNRFRPAEVPILLSDTTKVKQLGFKVTRKLTNIIDDQLNFYLEPAERF
ncbi:MAG: GDP-6-deoxy-D-mannose reductase [candidate division WS2 bacterium]|nr:GDP-6-deoxy-D-mannose reductase [Candidatus Psychracetigena formicireducens]